MNSEERGKGVDCVGVCENRLNRFDHSPINTCLHSSILLLIHLLFHPLIHSFHPSIQSTPLHLAAGYNRVSIVQLLLDRGADVHAKDKGSVFFLF